MLRQGTRRPRAKAPSLLGPAEERRVRWISRSVATLTGLDAGYVQRVAAMHDTGRCRRDDVGGTAPSPRSRPTRPSACPSAARAEILRRPRGARARGQIAGLTSPSGSAATSALFLQAALRDAVGAEPRRRAGRQSAGDAGRWWLGARARRDAARRDLQRQRRGDRRRARTSSSETATAVAAAPDGSRADLRRLQSARTRSPEDTGLARTVKLGGWAHLRRLRQPALCRWRRLPRGSPGIGRAAAAAGQWRDLRGAGPSSSIAAEGGDSASGVTAYASGRRQPAGPQPDRLRPRWRSGGDVGSSRSGRRTPSASASSMRSSPTGRGTSTATTTR